MEPSVKDPSELRCKAGDVVMVQVVGDSHLQYRLVKTLGSKAVSRSRGIETWTSCDPWPGSTWVAAMEARIQAHSIRVLESSWTV